MARNADDTRARILAAAIEEFAAHGLAGARVERITAAARANPKSLYAYFGSKTRLFDAAVTHVLLGLGEQVPLTPDDLPGYAGRAFDWIVAHPEAVRLNLWRNLEAWSAGPDDGDVYREVVQVMRRSRPPDATDIDPADLLVLVFGMISAWAVTARVVLTADGRETDDPERIADHRVALVDAVRRLQHQPGATTPGPRAKRGKLQARAREP